MGEREYFSTRRFRYFVERKKLSQNFFEQDKKLYITEEKRYVMTKIFNNNDYNLEVEERVLGLPDDNLGLNSRNLI